MFNVKWYFINDSRVLNLENFRLKRALAHTDYAVNLYFFFDHQNTPVSILTVSLLKIKGHFIDYSSGV